MRRRGTGKAQPWSEFERDSMMSRTVEYTCPGYRLARPHWDTRTVHVGRHCLQGNLFGWGDYLPSAAMIAAQVAFTKACRKVRPAAFVPAPDYSTPAAVRERCAEGGLGLEIIRGGLYAAFAKAVAKASSSAPAAMPARRRARVAA